ncbi:hypothetical protein TNCV_3150581 [Trichonephila clavipes]|nr:hypothetical protein TNCV_3150581 [Trichonephila clavipes]
MSSEVLVDRWDWVDDLQFIGQEYPTHALLDSSPVRDCSVTSHLHYYHLGINDQSLEMASGARIPGLFGYFQLGNVHIPVVE